MRAVLEEDADNRRSLASIDESLIILCLDMNTPHNAEQYHREIWHSGGSNRWFDKTQIMVFCDGKAGLLHEHSPIDGITTSRAVEYILRYAAALPPLIVGPSEPAEVVPLRLPAAAVSSVTDAQMEIAEIAKKFVLNVCAYVEQIMHVTPLCK